ncbi:hypothetical protein M011DRAFT_475853 [Sporormia fimetaria CBS 119925]|uniref:protein-ribulosamine 3-kinase n=1 Tax=Sporormia fimetaria CBS 119925 TaxID=1340428 RepID=A0A6A6VEU7_9PLEO|nr:hypothetical protein M011DRAFT_475853 [Sporormia fimetaria CBS 119925]
MSTDAANFLEKIAQQERDRQTPRVALDRLDDNIKAALPKGLDVLSIVPHGESAWCKTYKISTKSANSSPKSYFLKFEPGALGSRMMRGAFTADSTLHSYIPSNVPKPIAFGSCKDDPETWFYISAFHNMSSSIPSIPAFIQLVADFHTRSMGHSPDGKFGFGVPTHLANLANESTWCDSWETWYTRALTTMLAHEKRTQGPDADLDVLFAALIEKVVPRLLRPLETNGRSITPCLIHSDLWHGNCMVDADSGAIMLFDCAAVWGHHEAEMGPWRAERYRFGEEYFREYRRVVGVSEPRGDWEGRNALYALRYDLLCSALYPGQMKFREMVKQEIRRLVEMYPDGYQGE